MSVGSLRTTLAPYREKVPKTRYYVMRKEILTPVDLLRGYAAFLRGGTLSLTPKLETFKPAIQANMTVIELSASIIQNALESHVFETERDVLAFWNANRQHVYDIIVAANRLAVIKNQIAPRSFRETEWLGSLINTAHQLAEVVEVLTNPDLPLS